MKKTNIILAILLILSMIILTLSFIEKKKELDIYDYAKGITFKNDSQLLAVAYLNSVEEATSRYVSNLDSIKIYQVSGNEKYLIIPRYKDMEISIYEINEDEEENKKKNLLTTTKSLFVINCNTEEESNIILKVKYKDKTIEYIPSIKDSKLNKNNYVLDITKY